MPTVSICIPTYNRRDYLRETFASVFAPTCTDCEVVVVDDASTDGALEIVNTTTNNTRSNNGARI
jgi:glycosyltransferase involved in cell wall biosynthesis